MVPVGHLVAEPTTHAWAQMPDPIELRAQLQGAGLAGSCTLLHRPNSTTHLLLDPVQSASDMQPPPQNPRPTTLVLVVDERNRPDGLHALLPEQPCAAEPSVANVHPCTQIPWPVAGGFVTGRQRPGEVLTSGPSQK